MSDVSIFPVGLALGFADLDASTTLGDRHFAVAVDSTSADVTLTLPAASERLGRTFWIKKTVSANDVILAAAGSDEIDGEDTITLSAEWAYLQIVSDGVSNWWIVGKGVGGP